MKKKLGFKLCTEAEIFFKTPWVDLHQGVSTVFVSVFVGMLFLNCFHGINLC